MTTRTSVAAAGSDGAQRWSVVVLGKNVRIANSGGAVCVEAAPAKEAVASRGPVVEDTVPHGFHTATTVQSEWHVVNIISSSLSEKEQIHGTGSEAVYLL